MPALLNCLRALSRREHCSGLADSHADTIDATEDGATLNTEWLQLVQAFQPWRAFEQYLHM